MTVQTLYINNLPESLKPSTLIPLLHDLFIPFGPIIAIHAQHTLKKKGQAFLTFSHVNCAVQARAVMDGNVLLGRAMKVQFAKSVSQTAEVFEGKFVPRPRRKLRDEKRPMSLSLR